MSEPAMPTAKDRAETRDLAARIVESVRNDEPMALPLYKTDTALVPKYYCESVEPFAFTLAQEIELLRADLATALADLQGARGEIEWFRKATTNVVELTPDNCRHNRAIQPETGECLDCGTVLP